MNHLENFLIWFRENHTAISWWVIGWLSFSVVDSLIKEDYGFVLTNSVLMVVNYFMWKKNK